MKHTTSGLALLASLALLTGCGDSSSPSGSTSQTMSEATAAAKKSASDATAAVGQAATDATAATKQAASDAATAVNTQATALLDQAKKLIQDGKGSEAMAKLKDLGNLKLSPEHQKMVDDLMAQAQKALGGATDAAKKTADSLLKK